MLSFLKKQLQDAHGCTFRVRVRTRAKKSCITTLLDDGSIKVDIAAVPEAGKANEELILLFSQEFGVSRECIEILSGKRGKQKVVRVRRA